MVNRQTGWVQPFKKFNMVTPAIKVFTSELFGLFRNLKYRKYRSSERNLSALKIILFYPKYQKTIFSDLIIPKPQMKRSLTFLQKNHGLSP